MNIFTSLIFTFRYRASCYHCHQWLPRRLTHWRWIPGPAMSRIGVHKDCVVPALHVRVDQLLAGIWDTNPDVLRQLYTCYTLLSALDHTPGAANEWQECALHWRTLWKANQH